MTDEIVQIIVNSSGAAAVAVIAFLTFRELVKIFTERIQKITDSFNNTIIVYLEKTAAAEIKTQTKMAELSERMSELKAANEAVFSHNWKLFKEVKQKDEIITKYKKEKK
jgi:hypothetical protein